MVLQMPIRLALCGLALVVAVPLAGCGSDDKPKAAPTPTSKPSVPPGLDTAPPRKPKAAETEESAVEFARYFALLVQHVVRIRNVRPMMAETLDQAKCTSCRGVSEFIEDLRDDKLWEIEPDLRLGKFSARRTANGFKVSGVFQYPRGRFVTVDGTQKNVAVGGPYRFVGDLVWNADGSEWRILDYAFGHKRKG